MPSVDEPRLSRNYGFWSPAEQQALLASDVAIAGVGGDGYLLGLGLVRMGAGRLRIADPEVFEAENINRVPGANVPNLGRRKVDCFHEDAMAINPSLKLEVLPEGVTRDNIGAFLDGADLVIDETELTRLELGTMIADQARRLGIPNLQVMNVGFAGQATSFHPTRRPTFRDMIGVDDTTPLDEVANIDLDLRLVLPFLPEYLDEGVLTAIARGAPLPSIVQGVNVAAALGASQAFLHLVAGTEGSHRPEPIWYPEIVYVDSLTGTCRRSSDTPRTHDLSLETMRANNRRGLITCVQYPLPSDPDRADRSSTSDPPGTGGAAAT
jgi:molybdopterin/thiamine biosynthesis adenylyltransferase